MSHHHDGSVLGEWTHRTYWHTHEHDHRSVVHCHHYGAAEEAEEHGKEAHVHDHAAPVH